MNIDKTKLKKILIPAALCLAGVCVTLALIFALVGGKKASEYTVSFQQGDGYTYVTDTKNGAKVKPGETITFSLETSVFYTGSPVVFVNNEPIVPKNGGVYEVTINKNTSISVAGVNKDVSNMAGTGAIDDAFLVTRPIDLLYIAKQVNAGNRTYVNGSYILANDIDCKGEELEVIGDFSTESAYFAGAFSCPTNTETNEMERHAIKNFTINTDNSNYVGLFGCVMVDMSVTSSGLFYGIQLENFTINASITDPMDESNLSIVCGSLIGYGIGARTYLCDALNGEINVYADDNYFSFAGGLMGYQQGLYAQDFNKFYPAEVAYAAVSVDINIVQGCALYAGGISGYLVTNYPFAASYIHNSYATGSVTGAIRAGGIAGGLGQYTSVSNCYALGEAVAKSNFSATSFANSSVEYCIASAGGLIGYAENDSIVQDSFCAGKAYAYAVSGKNYQKTGAVVGYGPEAETSMANAEKYIEYNCLSDVKAADIDTVKTTLGWASYNWVFDLNSYPTINYEPSAESNSFTITAKFVVKNSEGKFESLSVGNQTQTQTSVDLTETLYTPISEDFKQGNFQIYYTATDANYKGYLSYGYFLDEACTIKMPFSYLPTKDTTIYVAFADPSPIVGTYYIKADNGDVLNLDIQANGMATYTDGAITQETTYAFDGETLYLDSARFSRYFIGELENSETEDSSVDLSGLLIADITQFNNFDMSRYLYYAYKATLCDDGSLPLYDGTYYTKDAPIVASKNYSSAQTQDPFKGTWVQSAAINKVYTFDGSNWSYKYSGYALKGYTSVEERILERASGTYTQSGNTLRLSNGATASFNSDGFLEIKDAHGTQVYYPELSFVGTWEDRTQGAKLIMKGINSDGLGQATLRYAGDSYDYTLTYEKSTTNNFICFYENKNIFGYAMYDRASNLLIATLYNITGATSEYTAFTFFLTDTYVGDWISNDDSIYQLSFNGFGMYEMLDLSGTVTVNEEKVPVTYSLIDSTLNGTFFYNGKIYTLVYEEASNRIVLTSGETEIEMERKDWFADKVMVDVQNREFVFDGKSGLLNGGTFTFDGKTYGYKESGNGYTVTDNGKTVGSIKRSEKTYDVTIDGTTHALYIANDLMGDWAIGGEFSSLSIGATDLQGTVKATFKNNNVTLTYFDSTILTFKYKDEHGMPITYYVYRIDDATIALSQHTDLFSGEYSICSKADRLFGTWEKLIGGKYTPSISFDGLSSDYANGTAKITVNGADTLYYYSIKEEGILMWSQEVLNGERLYYKLTETDELENTDAFYKNGKGILRTEVDSLCFTKAKDANGVTYIFDGLGTLTADNGKTYSYKATAFNANSTANLTLTDETGKEYTATLNYQDNSNITLTIHDAA